MKKTVAVIGGGPAGMMAAGMAASCGHRVTIFEKNDRLGKKLLITGKGRCNITHAGDVEDLLHNIPGNASFLYSAFYGLDSEATRQFFHNLGLPTVVERGNRVFPQSGKAADVLEALQRFLNREGVAIRYGADIVQLDTNDGTVTGVIDQKGNRYKAQAVIIATGGLSYPTTGSTGEGYTLAKTVGHSVTPLHPSLVPLIAAESWVKELQGLSLRNVGLTVKVAGKKVYEDFGEMLFTHFGLSGPVVLSASRAVLDKLNQRPVFSFDLKPALTEKQLDTRLLRDFEKYKNKDFINSLDELLPQKLIPVVVSRLGIDPRQKVHLITKAQRKEFLQLLKAFDVTVTGTRGFKEAVITAGGVQVDEIRPNNMASKLVQGLYFAGEVLDVDGYTGGFNLQIAFSTGYLAGQGIE